MDANETAKWAEAIAEQDTASRVAGAFLLAALFRTLRRKGLLTSSDVAALLDECLQLVRQLIEIGAPGQPRTRQRPFPPWAQSETALEEMQSLIQAALDLEE